MRIEPVCYKKILESALMEDLGEGDVTTDNIVEPDIEANAVIIAKEEGMVAGIGIAGEVFNILDKEIQFKVITDDGRKVRKGDILAKIKGRSETILKGERTALNFLQRMSGIATKTARCVHLISKYKAKIVDTRKTAPGLRIFDKYAVRVGGGFNHRFNLSSGILIKDNHIISAGGIKNAIFKVKENAPHTLKIEVEVENIEQLKSAIQYGADIIMLDNMNLEDMKKSVGIAKGKVLLEASGNVSEDKLIKIAQTGVDFISMGALTHSVKAFDVSLKFS